MPKIPFHWQDHDYTVRGHVTYWDSPATFDDPGDGPEVEIQSILDEQGREIDDDLFDEMQEDVEEAVYKAELAALEKEPPMSSEEDYL